ncbi:MAG: hypothetical protein IPI97_06650 [Nitrosomonas sp.]|nr:hypothetical protein [Nitrosomonas sp.]MBK7364675.1 hypothetical protein [Nitrosomonas sp.]
MDKTNRVFISFALRDTELRDKLIEQLKQTHPELNIVFMSEKKSWENSWKAECQGQVDGCDGAIGIITKNISRADGQLWELRCVLEAQMKLLLIGDDEVCEMSAKKLPELIRDEDILPWGSSSISSFLNRLK